MDKDNNMEKDSIMDKDGIMDKDSNLAEDKIIVSDNTFVGVNDKEEEILVGGNIKVVEGTVSINCIRVKDNGAGIDKLP